MLWNAIWCVQKKRDEIEEQRAGEERERGRERERNMRVDMGV